MWPLQTFVVWIDASLKGLIEFNENILCYEREYEICNGVV